MLLDLLSIAIGVVCFGALYLSINLIDRV